MKTTLLTFSILISGFVISQCSPTIPSNAMVMSTTQTIGFGGAQLWICPGVTITSNGGSHTVFLETGATFAAGGGSNTIYCPPGGTVNVTSGSNIIYYVNTSDLLSTGGGPTLNQCSSIVYNYSQAPVPGCQQTTGVVSLSEPEMLLFPNPCQGSFTIVGSFDHPQIRVTDLAGRAIVCRQEYPGQYSLEQVSNGFYWLQITGADGNIQVRTLQVTER